MRPELMQQAVDVIEQFGKITEAAESLGIPESTFRRRLDKGRLHGYRPRAPKEFKPVIRERLGRSHMVIPDIQAKPGVSNDHLEWIANYALDKRPDVIVQIGDWADMPSLSSYDKGKRSYEGRRYVKDIDAANDSLMRFERVLEDYNRSNPATPYNPDKHITLGNHEQRILRATELDAMLDGKLLMSDLQFEDRGWNTHPFLAVIELDGIQYSHYFVSGAMGRPVSSAAALLKARGGSATMGHVQKMDVAYHPQTQQIGLMCATCYLHDESYLGPQGNEAPRQIVMKHEVEDGRYDLMAVSLRFLKKRYS
jgi:hypothetical protein